MHKDKIKHKYKNKNKRKTDELKIDKNTLCKLINASIEEENKACHDYIDILEIIPNDDNYEECRELVTEILEDEISHSLALIKIGKQLGCEQPELTDDDKEMLRMFEDDHETELD